jgi:hypothetical protein
MAATVPPWLATMRQITGTRALGDSPVILSWPKKIGELFPDTKSYCDVYQHDTTAWCGLTVGYCMATSGIKPVFGIDENSRFLWALAWKQFGTDGGDTPRPGDVLVFQWSNGGHHVTLFEQAQGNDIYVCRGGNQNHQVKLSNFPKRCCIAIRRPTAPDPAVKLPADVVQVPAQMQSGVIATIFGGAGDPKASAYDGHVIDDVELGVALPSRMFDPRPNVRVWKDGKSVTCKVVHIGPWNTDDPYWQTGTRPKAEAGIDSHKTNGAGIDLTPATAHAIGLQDKGLVDWEFVDGQLSGQIVPDTQPDFPDLVQQLIAALEGKMPANPTTTAQPDLATLIQQALVTMQTLAAQGKQPQQTPSGQQGPTADQVQQFIKVFTPLIGGVAGTSGGLGQVNGALGDTIGNLLNGKKSAIGIIGAMVTAVLQAVGPSLPTVLPLVGSFAGLGQAALPIFLAIAAWGVLGKLEKWQLPATTQPKQ